ncbi:hypothetical protein DE146DRAFT_424065 [Phaeosphaeria sp. MPI-PUGE-AT-0046c]|nr:hypothetical protein DE146DRAFT_424065 [Phaeosphaeria sp. MPI-PUGE-AT-0046c]
MSWSFHLQKINASFEHIAYWYQQFIDRTELHFQTLRERIIRLEDQAYRGPSDEQVERVLRKILAERFSESEGRATLSPHPNIMKEEECFVEDLRDQARLKAVVVDPALLFVDPEAVPSIAYRNAMKVLDRRLMDYPELDQNKSLDPETGHLKPSYGTGQPKSSHDV